MLLVLFCVLLGSCASKPLYYWGNYEETVYHAYADGGAKFDPTKEIELLQKDISYADKKGLRLPPGFHAHLGALYSQIGDDRLAQQHFIKEQNMYPESKKLMTRFLGATKK